MLELEGSKERESKRAEHHDPRRAMTALSQEAACARAFEVNVPGTNEKRYCVCIDMNQR